MFHRITPLSLLPHLSRCVALSCCLFITCHIVVLTCRPRYPLCRATPFVRSTRGAWWFVVFSSFIFHSLTPFLLYAPLARSFATRRLCRIPPRHASVTRHHLAPRCPSSRVALRLVARRLSCRLTTSRHLARTCGGNGRDSVSGQVGRVDSVECKCKCGCKCGSSGTINPVVDLDSRLLI